MGGFPTIRHNEIRDITTSLLTKVMLPQNLPYSHWQVKRFIYVQQMLQMVLALISGLGVFGSKAQDAFFDIRVFHSNAPSNRSSLLEEDTRSMRLQRKENMPSAFVTSNMECLHLLFFLLQEEWAGRQQSFTRGWQT